MVCVGGVTIVLPIGDAIMAGDDSMNTAAKTAAERVAQVSGHMGSSKDGLSNEPSEAGPRRRRAKKNAVLELPADHSDILGQLDTLRKMAATPDITHRGYVRQKKSGKLWVRERVDQLLDTGTFVEVGSVSGEVTWEKTGPLTEKPIAFTPSNNVQG